MKLRLSLTLILFVFSSIESNAQKNLQYFIEQAKANSPLIADNKNQIAATQIEIDRLKAFYTKAQITLTGNYQFSPILSRDNGNKEVVLNPAEAVNYSGYDIAASNGGVYQGLINYNQPLFNGERYKASAAQALINSKINENTIQLTVHDLEKLITDQYILCLQDRKQELYFSSLISIITEQKAIVSKLVLNGIAKQSDLSLLTIEYKTQEVALNSFRSTYKRDLLDLTILCGLPDTTFQILDDLDLQLNQKIVGSKFVERYRLDSLALIATQNVFELKYKPSVGAYANAGLNAVYAPTIPNRFGVAAGINFTLNLFDGNQRSLSQQRTSVLMKSTQAYRTFFTTQNEVRKNRILNELKSVSERLTLATDQLSEYQKLLEFYKQELSRGQISVINYVATLKNVATAQRDFLLLQANEQLLINLYNYWNW